MWEIYWCLYLLRPQIELLQEHTIFLVIEVIDQVMGSKLLGIHSLKFFEWDLVQFVPGNLSTIEVQFSTLLRLHRLIIRLGFRFGANRAAHTHITQGTHWHETGIRITTDLGHLLFQLRFTLKLIDREFRFLLLIELMDFILTTMPGGLTEIILSVLVSLVLSPCSWKRA